MGTVQRITYSNPVATLRSAIQSLDLALNGTPNKYLTNVVENNNLARDALARDVYPALERLAAGENVPFSISTAAYELRQFVDIATSPKCDWTNDAYFEMIREKYDKIRPEIVKAAEERERIGRGPSRGEGGLETAMR